MINITDKHNCCGCEACVQICPKQCIAFVEDDEGFRYPIVDESVCVDCGLCERICPMQSMREINVPLKVLAAYNEDEDTRMVSSSGGVFSLLAQQTIDKGGVVFGARFNENWQVVIDSAETEEDYKRFRGSKYVQADTNNSFVKCKNLLTEGREVLFTGTPCQIAGLKSFLRKEYEQLITVDLACHGVPSPKVWNDYLECEIERQYKTAHRAVVGNNTVFHSLSLMSLIKDIRFREKTDGWKKYRFVLQIAKSPDAGENNSVLSSIHDKNPYFQAFNMGVILRPCCYTCTLKNQCRSGSDITLADFWGIENVFPSMDDDKGTSLVLVNTEKGDRIIKRIDLSYLESTYEIALQYNAGLRVGSNVHPKRKWFYKKYQSSDNVVYILEQSIRASLFKRFRSFLSKVKRLIIS